MSNAWSPSKDVDAAVVGWMKEHGWPVTIVNYDFDFENFAWRHEAPGVSYTLRISQRVLEDYPPGELIRHLNRLGVADVIGKNPKAYALVMREGPAVVLTVSPSPPSKKPSA